MSNNPILHSQPIRPYRVILLAIAAILMSGWNGLQASEAILFRHILREYGAQTSFYYIITSGAFWFTEGLIVASGLLLGKRWAWFSSLGTVIGYPFWIWFNRLVLQKSHTNWIFASVITLVCCICLFAILFTQKTTSYFQIRKANR